MSRLTKPARRYEMCRIRLRAWTMALLLMSSGVTGCAAPAKVGVEFCEHARPIYFDDVGQVEATPAPIRRQIRDGNATWRTLCGA
ncbi:hypothetical protein A9973_05600 [Achromobacter sp. UMC46]|nr:hypothetical protein [Achromobacter sp. UMC46]